MNANRKIIIAGGSGFLGRALEDFFQKLNWKVIVLTRHPTGSNDIGWDSETLGEWTSRIENADAVINLSGRSVNCRYHARNRTDIMDSRTRSTRVLGEAVSRCEHPPALWLNMSTATIYKHTFGPAHSEEGEIGAAPEAKDAFSIEVAKAWEREFQSAPTPRTRKLVLRTAMVLGRGENSVFPMLRRLAKLGLGGRMGSGKQFVSWIHEIDFCRAIEFLIERSDLDGIFNIAAPNPVTNLEMMRLFRKICKMPIGLPATKWMLEVGAFVMRTETELILKSRRVGPARLLKAGFQFQFPEMCGALKSLNA